MQNDKQSSQTKKGNRWGYLIPVFILIIGVLIVTIKSLCPSKEAIKAETGVEYDPKTGIIRVYAREDFANPESPDKKSSEPYKSSTADSEEQRTKIHEKVGYPNIALNKPVVELFLDIKRIKGEDQNKYQHVLQFDSIRLMSYVQFYEWHSVNLEGYPSHLTDGNHDTRAYPADLAFDYVVDLKGTYTLSEIRLDWGGTFGSHSEINNYITRWELYGQDSFSSKNYPTMEDWELITNGGIPGEKITIVSEKDLKKPVRRLRIRASSEAKYNRRANWIGIHEIEAYGTPLNNN